ncbi:MULTISPECIES: NAD(P)/FAD-dependent oxidoreductase [unclassified Bradyrhizobium]|uniref:NAD(P)/FAD-dependent oxidoreductase n=1 Tax=unclassified Bradyrhizobium TaxID=2631580 RepID=UPI002306BCD6|nr:MULTISPECIES: NAD(P)/FAD-dependent oxidoreductase [unclassified Bradyrhizobium]MDA9406145.1 (2Fe-2S)-binding protein [Bradyrhizobium sp. CCBAU 45384]MDA9440435.1 (2Fe-2S)-binding protein [Bradyrhizobium sp. CCBAU 51745]
MSTVIVGAGPAGTRAAEVLVGAGLRPVVIDEGLENGGRIYQRQPAGFRRAAYTLYGFEAAKARAIHDVFDRLRPSIDFRPRTLAWNLRPGVIDTICEGKAHTVPFAQTILCTGAMDRVIPLPGWTLPGVFTLGGSQISLKTQGCAIGAQVAFVGTGPLLYLVAYQYARAGAQVVAVLDTTPFATKAKRAFGLIRGGTTFAKGLYYIAWLRAHGIPIVEGAAPLAIEGNGRVESLSWRDAGGARHEASVDAVALGWGLKPEAQLADLAGVPFDFDPVQHNWVPHRDPSGRTSVDGVFLAGDGSGIRGADLAEAAGARAAWAVLAARGLGVDARAVARLDAILAAGATFRAALERAFPFPAKLAADIADDTILCRCELITAGELRAAANEALATLPPPEVNRAKALTRVGMGRCQGRVCGAAAAEVLASTLSCPVEQVGRLRGQPPVKPIPILPAEAA